MTETGEIKLSIQAPFLVCDKKFGFRSQIKKSNTQTNKNE